MCIYMTDSHSNDYSLIKYPPPLWGGVKHTRPAILQFGMKLKQSRIRKVQKWYLGQPFVFVFGDLFDPFR